MTRSPSVLAPSARNGSRDTRRRDCSRLQQLAGLRTASTRFHRRPSEEGWRGLPRASARERPVHRGVPARVVSPHRGGGVASGSMPREQRRTLSMMVMLRPTGVGPHVTTTALRLGVNRVSGASPRNPDHRSGSTGMSRWSSTSRSRLLVACAHRIGVVPRLRSPDRPSVPFSDKHFPSLGNPPPPTEVEDDLRWTRFRRPSRIASHDRRRSPTGRCRPVDFGGVPDFRALLRRRVRDVPWPLQARQRPILPWAFFPSKILRSPLSR